jgi:hypothetical protein
MTDVNRYFSMRKVIRSIEHFKGTTYIEVSYKKINILGSKIANFLDLLLTLNGRTTVARRMTVSPFQ